MHIETDKSTTKKYLEAHIRIHIVDQHESILNRAHKNQRIQIFDPLQFESIH